MTELESAAIELYDYIWHNVGTSADWPLELGGDDAAINEVIRLLNKLQDEIVARDLHRIDYAHFGKPR
jgi:hypothetical protein